MEEPEPTSGFRIIVPYVGIACVCVPRGPWLWSVGTWFTGTHWHPPALTAICSLIRNRITPFGMPEYDGGERFDLRLPYVDQGWVDEDADPVKQFRRFIGLDKKSKDTEIQSKKSYKGKGKK